MEWGMQRQRGINDSQRFSLAFSGFLFVSLFWKTEMTYLLRSGVGNTESRGSLERSRSLVLTWSFSCVVDIHLKMPMLTYASGVRRSCFGSRHGFGVWGIWMVLTALRLNYLVVNNKLSFCYHKVYSPDTEYPTRYLSFSENSVIQGMLCGALAVALLRDNF